jgi:CsoR family transcriptional regulator, copper-sensing transcriptional repressor
MICNKDVKNRISRAKGQMQGVLDMMDKDHSCMEIVTQLKAIRASVDQSIGLLTTQNLTDVIKDIGHLDDERVNEAMQMILKGR